MEVVWRARFAQRNEQWRRLREPRDFEVQTPDVNWLQWRKKEKNCGEASYAPGMRELHGLKIAPLRKLHEKRKKTWMASQRENLTKVCISSFSPTDANLFDRLLRSQSSLLLQQKSYGQILINDTSRSTFSKDRLLTISRLALANSTQFIFLYCA